MGIFRKNKTVSTEPDSKLYRTISLTAIIGLFVIAGVIVLAICRLISFSSTIFGLLGTLGFFCIGCIMILPWIKRLESGEFKKTSIVFMCFVAVCIILWIIALWMGVVLYKQLKSDSDKAASTLYNTLNFIKVTGIISLQFMVVSVVATCFTKYKKTMLAFQGITYFSYAFVDFYMTFFLACLQINTVEQKIAFSKSISVLGNKWMVALVVLSIVYVIISNAVMKKIEIRKSKNTVEDMQKLTSNVDELKSQVQVAPQQKTTEEKLVELKNMLDKQLITQEEYDKKREDILKDL